MPTKVRILFIVSLIFCGLVVLYYKQANQAESSTLEDKLLVKLAGELGRKDESAQSVIANNHELAGTVTEEDSKLKILEQIIISKNDNDPRIDSEFKNLSPDLKLKLQDKYQHLPQEQRNERGLIVMILARELKTVEDIEFLKSIYGESPCLGLENCNVRDVSDPHHSALDQVSLNYPQMVVLHQISRQFEKHPEKFTDSSVRDSVQSLLKLAKKFPVPLVSQKAEEIYTKYGM